MVSQITTGYATDEKGRPYRRRRYVPALLAVVVLAVAGVVAWSAVLTEAEQQAAPTDCNQPTAATLDPDAPPQDAATPPEPVRLDAVSRTEMLEVSPAPLSTFGVRVLNASDERGAARSVSDDLTAQGFNPVADTPYADDPVYPNRDLNCVAQIRFGPAGRPAAAAVWLAEPCAQLVEDQRRGTSVDLVLGTYYEGGELSQDAQAALDALRSADPNNPQTGVDPALLQAVHSRPC